MENCREPVTYVANKVSVIIVTYNSLPSLQECLKTLLHRTGEIDWELIVIDNNSVDGSASSVREHFPDATVIEQFRNLGFAAACNEGAGLATGEHLLFLNPDVLLDSGAIEALQQVLTSTEKAGVVSARLRFPDGSFQPTCRRWPTAGNLLFSRGSILSRLLRQESRYTLPDQDSVSEVPACAGTAMMIDHSLFDRIGQFDRRYFMYMEDTDLCFRLGRSGYRNLFVPSAGGIHDWGKGSSVGQLRRKWYHHVSCWRYFLKHSPNGFSIVLLPALLLLNFLLAAILPGMNREGDGSG